jgi:hypothetical protein
VETWILYIYQSVDGLVRFLGYTAAPWLLLLILLIAGLMAWRQMILARRALDRQYGRHLANITRFRGELAHRQALENRPRLEHWL